MEPNSLILSGGWLKETGQTQQSFGDPVRGHALFVLAEYRLPSVAPWLNYTLNATSAAAQDESELINIFLFIKKTFKNKR